jgi:hypothetical protein
MIELVKRAAEIRGDIPISREFIKEALKGIKSGKFEASKYPTGEPSLKDVYDIAFSLMPKQ